MSAAITSSVFESTRITVRLTQVNQQVERNRVPFSTDVGDSGLVQAGPQYSTKSPRAAKTRRAPRALQPRRRRDLHCVHHRPEQE